MDSPIPPSVDLICRAYPEIKPFLEYKNAFELLIAVILSAQCTDAQVNKITPALFKHYPNPYFLSKAPIEHLQELIFKTGFYKAKARNIKETAALLIRRFEGEVPEAMEDLTSLPGVGRKTANVIRGTLFGRSAIIVDTHFMRVVRRLGLTESQDPVRIERDLASLIPEDRHYHFSMAANLHGRSVCKARSPSCELCVVKNLCPSSEV